MAHHAGALLRPPPAAELVSEVYPELARDWPSDGLGSIADLAAQLPDPKELTPGSVVIVRPSARLPRTWWAQLLGAARFWRRRPAAHRAVRCTALLALGYRDVSVGQDPHTREELVWGVVASSNAISARSS